MKAIERRTKIDFIMSEKNKINILYSPPSIDK
jgi:hypothetical protein